MKKMIAVTIALLFVAVGAGAANAQADDWTPGGPKYLYIKPLKKVPWHDPYDKGMKCAECHKWDGVDAYSTATMGLAKSTTGRLSKKEIEQAVAKLVNRHGDYREIYALATSFNNKPLATIIEFVLDPATMCFYAVSEKQGEKLFHIAANPQVSLAQIRQREDAQYFAFSLGMQVVGTAEQLRGTDPGFEAAARIYAPSTLKLLPPQQIEALKQKGIDPVDFMVQNMKRSKIITKVTPERIVMASREFSKQGKHFRQIWLANEDRP